MEVDAGPSPAVARGAGLLGSCGEICYRTHGLLGGRPHAGLIVFPVRSPLERLISSMRRLLQLMLAVGLASGVSQRACADDESKAVLEKGIKALGGEAKLVKLRAGRSKTKGNLEINGSTIPFTGDSTMQLPDRLKIVMQLDANGQEIRIVQVVDGDKGWINANGQTMDLPDVLLGELKESLYAAKVETLVPLLKEKGFILTSLGESKIDDRPAQGVKVASAGHKDIELYFDKENGLIVKRSRTALDGSTMQEILQESSFRDYKDVDGLKRPTKIAIQNDGKKFLDGEMSDYKFVDKFEASEFAKP